MTVDSGHNHDWTPATTMLLSLVLGAFFERFLVGWLFFDLISRCWLFIFVIYPPAKQFSFLSMKA